jgi:hydrogenase expression/formation protein HypC
VIADQTRTDQAAECSGESCVTCSDAAVAGPVLELLEGGLAIVAVGSHELEVSVALVTAGVGDTVVVHAGEAIAVVPR